ncbi:hypothetical protein WMW71_11910 [Flavobacterium buctense]|uniref:Glycosyltransferase RgtA/B/C/D-like domain-containing protein n=1 Tax=Flavobacterium buctense TaxID=1648146 RepID=A0ABU9E313_9FLAO|nr:hypothetical protein [Flavobacterium buctense]
MSALLKKYRYHLLIILVGLICLEGVNFLLQLDRQTLVYPDCDNYLESAQKMYHKFTGHYYRPMVMAFITGFPYLFGSSDAGIFQWSLWVNVFCWLGTSLLLFEIAKHFVKEKYAFVFAILPFFILGNIILNFHILTENIFVFFIMLAFYCLFQYYKTAKFWYLSLSLSLLLSSMLVKPGAKFLAIIITLFFIREIIKNYASKSMVFIYGSLLMISIQVVGMKVQYGDFTISYIDGVTYHNYLFSKAECFKNGKEYSQINNTRADYLFSLSFPNQKKIAFEDAKRQIRTNFPNVIKAFADDIKDNAVSGNACIKDLLNHEKKDNFLFWKAFVFEMTKWQNRVFTLLAILLSAYFLWKYYRKDKFYFFIAFFITYIIVLSGVSCGQGDRFHLITFPFVILLLAKFLTDRNGLKPSSERLQK